MRLFVLAFAVTAQTERRTNMGKSGDFVRRTLSLSGNGSLMFACLRKQTNSDIESLAATTQLSADKPPGSIARPRSRRLSDGPIQKEPSYAGRA
jgi:hypothetical protein